MYPAIIPTTVLAESEPTPFVTSYHLVKMATTNMPLLDSIPSENSNTIISVGVAIFRRSPLWNTSCKYQLLILKRSPKVSEDPNRFELPSGYLQGFLGETQRQAIIRETQEKTGLVVTEVLGQLENTRWRSPDGLEMQNLQFNFVVRVQEPYVIRENGEIHEKAMWLDKRFVEDCPTTTKELKKTLKDAFHFAETYFGNAEVVAGGRTSQHSLQSTARGTRTMPMKIN